MSDISPIPAGDRVDAIDAFRGFALAGTNLNWQPLRQWSMESEAGSRAD